MNTQRHALALAGATLLTLTLAGCGPTDTVATCVAGAREAVRIQETTGRDVTPEGCEGLSDAEIGEAFAQAMGEELATLDYDDVVTP